jgi:hypothetical protein
MVAPSLEQWGKVEPGKAGLVEFGLDSSGVVLRSRVMRSRAGLVESCLE